MRRFLTSLLSCFLAVSSALAQTEPLKTTESGGRYTQHVNIENDARIQEAINEIYSRWGVRVSVTEKQKTLIKFGRCDNVTTATTGTTIWQTCTDQAHETYAAANTNPIDRLSSSSASDTGSVTIEGHSESGGNKTFSTQTITLAGQTPVPIPTPLNRLTRLFNAGSSNFVGTVYGYEAGTVSAGKPTSTTTIHISAPAGFHNQSFKASTSLSSTDYWIITGFYADVLSKTSAYADVSLQIRESGKVFRTAATISAADSHQGKFIGEPYAAIAPANSDVRLVGIGGATISVSGGIEGYLASVVQ